MEEVGDTAGTKNGGASGTPSITSLNLPLAERSHLVLSVLGGEGEGGFSSPFPFGSAPA